MAAPHAEGCVEVPLISMLDGHECSGPRGVGDATVCLGYVGRRELDGTIPSLEARDAEGCRNDIAGLRKRDELGAERGVDALGDAIRKANGVIDDQAVARGLGHDPRDRWVTKRDSWAGMYGLEPPHGDITLDECV